jgi:hypothetical protein
MASASEPFACDREHPISGSQSVSALPLRADVGSLVDGERAVDLDTEAPDGDRGLTAPRPSDKLLPAKEGIRKP